MKPLNLPDRNRILLNFLFGNYALSLIIAFPFLSFGPLFDDLQAWIYTHIAFLSTFAIFMILFGLILWPFTRFIKSAAQLFILPPALLFLFQVLLLIDVKIFEIFRFHINGLVINTITTEGAGDSVTLGGKTFITLLFYLIILISFEWGLIWVLARHHSQRGIQIFHNGILRRAPLVLILFLLITIVSDKLIFAYANFHEMSNIIRYQKILPLYLPLFADETIEKYLGWKKEKSPIEYIAKSSLLNYPHKQFTLEENLNPINIVWIAVESWRFDMLNREVAPNITEFSDHALVFENHYSGGNATRFGIYSMFYGTYGTYWHQFLAERRSPVFMDILQKMGYDFKILSSTQLSYPEFRKTVFVKLPPKAIEDRLPGDNGVDRDPLIAKKFNNFIKSRDGSKPFFTFMFLDAPHAPYRYPENYAKFQPTIDEINYFEVKKAYAHVDQSHPLFNRYRNAIFFSDSVVNDILMSLRDNNLMDSTVVVITGDHGEEFDESGYYGHTSAYSEQQIKVPFILYIPGEKPGRFTRMTSHLDIVPTMLSLMGSRQDPALYSHGHSLLEEKGSPYVVSSGWDTFAIIDPEATLVLSSETYNARSAEVRIGHYQLAKEPRSILNTRGQELSEVTRKLSNFLK